MPPIADLMLMLIIQSHAKENVRLTDFSTVFKVSANLKLNESSEVKKELVGEAHLIKRCTGMLVCLYNSASSFVIMLECR